MASTPQGDPVPDGGTLPPEAVEELPSRRFGMYVHVPFCRTRCGYCDFNTYTADELGPGATRGSYAESIRYELDLAARVLGPSVPPIDTVFFGGGTPTLLPATELVGILGAITSTFALSDDVEVTTEANPDSVDPVSLSVLREGGINRISFGMQSTVPHVLATLDRTHDPARVPDAVRWARDAGFDSVSLDLIYGTPGESLDDWRTSLQAALALGPDHVSAYALIVEQGTALARRVTTGEVPAPDEDEMADKYLIADELLEAAGLEWYELSNWARNRSARSRHNRLYWTGANWWGIGPGAHSHVGGTRWWNVKHPAAYARRLQAGESPAQAREVLDGDMRRLEQIMLESRLSEGLSVEVLDDAGRAAVPGLVGDQLIERLGGSGSADRLVLTARGRLLADAVVRALTP